MNILVTGARGLVGSRFVEKNLDKYSFTRPSSNELDITNEDSTKKFILNSPVEAVINFAASTNVDEIEKERGILEGNAWKTNVLGAKNIAIAAKEKDIPFIQISTDMIFSGNKNSRGPYKESTLSMCSEAELSWYGFTKLNAEREIIKQDGKWIIVRISYPYRKEYEGKLDFARNIIKLYQENKLYPMFDDQFLTPTSIDELSEAIPLMLKKAKYKTIYHVASSNVTTPFEFAESLIFNSYGDFNVVDKTSFEQFRKNNKVSLRLQYGGLDTRWTQAQLGMKFKTWKNGVKILNSGVKKN